MKVISSADGRHVIRLDRGDAWPKSILMFLKERNIGGAFFYGLGAVEDPEIAFYDLQGEKKYIIKKVKGLFEVLNITGNVAMKDNTLVVHAHVTLGGKKYETYGGHLIGATVAGTLELCLMPLHDTIKRTYDDSTGLHLLQ